jgi:glucosamine--fructose-6-phosphate aminotransferase (isomerizing)
MNLSDEKYSQYALVREMMDTIDVVKNFDTSQTKKAAGEINSVGKLLMTGEGSSRISLQRMLYERG